MMRATARLDGGRRRGPASPVRLLVRAALAVVLACAGLLLAVPSGWAAEVRGGEDLTVAAGEVVDDDLYVAGDDVVVDGTVRGDLVVAAGTVTVRGTVEGDLMAAARTVVVEGEVGDDARLAGQAVVLRQDARIADDLVAGAFSVEARPGSVVGGDVLLGAYQGRLAGDVGGDVGAGAEGLALAGRIGGDVEASVSDAGQDGAPAATWLPGGDVPLPAVPSGLTLEDTARLEGDLSYRAGAEASVASGAEVAGQTRFEQIAAPQDPDPGPAGPVALLLEGLRRFVTLLVAGLLVLWLLPRLMAGAATALRTRPWPSLGWGVLAVAGAVVALFVVLVVTVLLALGFGVLTLGGLAAAVLGAGLALDVVLGLALVLGVGLLAPVVVSFTAGGGLLRDPVPARFGRRVLALALGLLAYVVLRAVPFLGAVVGPVVALFGLGAVVVWAWTARARRRGRAAGGRPGAAPGSAGSPGGGPAGWAPEAGGPGTGSGSSPARPPAPWSGQERPSAPPVRDAER